MSEVLSIDEFALRDRVRCPLGAAHQAPRENELEVLPVLREVVRAAALRKWMPRQQIRERLKELNRNWCAAHPVTYDRRWLSRLDVGPMKLFFIAARLDDLVHDFQLKVFQPVEPYELGVGNCRITGEYAVFQRGKRKEFCILYLRGAAAEHQPVKPLKRHWPDVVSYARLVDFAGKHPDAKYSILNWHFSRALHWPDHINLASARQCLEGAARILESGLVYPNPGYHCRDCQHPQCCVQRSVARRRPAAAKPTLDWKQKVEALLAAGAHLQMFGNPQEPAR